jgi:hypothetical protein
LSCLHSTSLSMKISALFFAAVTVRARHDVC